jgi:hypothetical protein
VVEGGGKTDMNNTMAIVKATYTKAGRGAKASIRYIAHRSGQDGQKITRTLFGSDGQMSRPEAYRMVDEAEKGSRFFRFVLSPDPKQEDTKQDLSLREITAQTMGELEDRLHRQVRWVAAIHADHTKNRHVHIVAIVPGHLQVADLKSLRQAATAASSQQRQQLDLTHAYKLSQEKQTKQEEEAEWSPGY